MHNKFTLTITDINGSKHYTLNQIVKKYLLYLLISVSILLVIGGITIVVFYNEISEFEEKKAALLKEHYELIEKRDLLQEQINEREREFGLIEEQVASIEEIIGISNDKELNINERLDNISTSSSEQERLLSFIPNGFVLPDITVTARFGWRQHPIKHKKEHHPGVDLRASTGTPVKVSANGVINYATFHRGGYGNLIIVDHGFGFQTRYAHLNKILVYPGQFVTKDQIIGEVGNTGLSTGPHLHYEVRFIGRAIEPMNFLRWNKDNFESIFEKERTIAWQSLIKMITNKNYQPQKNNQQTKPQS